MLNCEEDVAIYTLKAATDPKLANRVIIYRPPKNIVSQLDLVAAWELKTGRAIKRNHVPEQEIINLSESKKKFLQPTHTMHSRIYIYSVCT